MGTAVPENRRFGPYLLHERLGHGGMGDVYSAFDTRKDDRIVALKRLHPEYAANTVYKERFKREAELSARLNDPHVIPIHDYGEIDGHLYLDMRYVEGEDLATQLSKLGRLTASRAVTIIGQMATALDAAHRATLVHRDVKPSNVLLNKVNRPRNLRGTLVDVSDSPFCYLVDFGLAVSVGASRLTPTEHVVGTLAYMAPERFDTSWSPTASSDTYSLACVLYEMLTGEAPFSGDNARVVYSHLYSAPPTATERGAKIPKALDEVIRRGMAKDPADRHRSAGDLAADARKALSDHDAPPVEHGERRPGRPVRQSDIPTETAHPARLQGLRPALRPTEMLDLGEQRAEMGDLKAALKWFEEAARLGDAATARKAENLARHVLENADDGAGADGT